MKKIITVLLMMAVLACGCGEGDKQETQKQEVQKEVSNLYETEELVTVELDDVEFQIPKKWEETKKESGNNTYYYSDGMMVMIQTSESDFDNLDTLSEDEKEEAKESIISGMKEGGEYEELSGNFEEVSGITSIRIKGNGTISGKEGKQDSLMFAQNGIFYNFSIFVYKESNVDYEEDFGKLLESLKVSGIETKSKNSEEKVTDIENNSTESSNSMYLSKMPDSEENILKNIEITSDKTENGQIVVFITNNNEYVIPELEIQVLFKKGEEIVDTGEDGHDVLVPENTVVSKIDAPMDYDNYEINATVEWEYETMYRNWIYNLNISSNIGEDGVIIQFENIGDVDIEELEYIVVYYKDGKIKECSYDEDVYDLKAGDKIIEKSEVYGTEFDKYEVYINQAHTFDEKYTHSEPLKETLPNGIGKRTMESSNEEKINGSEEDNEDRKFNEESTEKETGGEGNDKETLASEKYEFDGGTVDMTLSKDSEDKYYYTISILSETPWKAAYAYYVCSGVANSEEFKKVAEPNVTMGCGDVFISNIMSWKTNESGETESIDGTQWISDTLSEAQADNNYSDEELKEFTDELTGFITDFIKK